MRSRKIATKADGYTPVAPEEALPWHQQQLLRKKSTGSETKAWLVVSESGKSHIEVVGKHSIMRRTGLGARDLRILDPTLSHPSTVVGRKRAIVVNLEQIKAIVTATEALVLSSKNPQLAAFANDLQCHLSNNYRAALGQAGDESGDHTDMGINKESPWVSASFLSRDDETERPSPRTGKKISVESPTMIPEVRGLSRATTLDAPKGAGSKVLPFEFQVLEVCLHFACKWLESEASQLEKEAYPALEELTTKINTLNLKRIRQIKGRLVSISCSVQKVRDQLEHLLDDDMDMAGMYLTDKLVGQHLEDTNSVAELDDVEALDFKDERYEDYKGKAKSSWESLGGSKPNIVELEMLLEAYFTQIEGTLSKLSTLREYVHDTEDYINLMLDDKQNQMLQMGVMVSSAILALQIGMVVVTTLNISLRITVFNKGNQNQFLATTLGLGSGSLIIYIMMIAFFKKTGLLV